VVGYAQRFSLYCGQNQRVLTEDQVDIMRQIAEYVINEGAISAPELNSVNTDLWRRGVMSLTAPGLESEMLTMAKFLLRTA
jgi:type I restriction enzyme R subunit